MVDVLRYVNANPGCTNQAVACAVGPNGSHAYGDRTVKRCWRRGLIANLNQDDPHARVCAWVLTDTGEVELRARRNQPEREVSVPERTDIDPVKAEQLAAEVGAAWEALKSHPVAGPFIRDFDIPLLEE
jgi:hypothetical protein